MKGASPRPPLSRLTVSSTTNVRPSTVKRSAKLRESELRQRRRGRGMSANAPQHASAFDLDEPRLEPGAEGWPHRRPRARARGRCERDHAGLVWLVAWPGRPPPPAPRRPRAASRSPVSEAPRQRRRRTGRARASIRAPVGCQSRLDAKEHAQDTDPAQHVFVQNDADHERSDEITECSQDTAYRDIVDLIERGALEKAPQGAAARATR